MCRGGTLSDHPTLMLPHPPTCVVGPQLGEGVLPIIVPPIPGSLSSGEKGNYIRPSTHGGWRGNPFPLFFFGVYIFTDLFSTYFLSFSSFFVFLNFGHLV